MEKKEAERVVNAIFSELGGRKGISNELDMIHDDTEVYNEMHAACVQRAIAAAAGEGKEWESRWQPE